MGWVLPRGRRKTHPVNGFGRGWKAPWVRTWVTRRVAAGGREAGGGAARATRYQSRCIGVPGTGSATRRPSASSAATASREIRVTPRPTVADSRIAPLDPTISVSGAMSSSVSRASVAARVPDPGSRSSQAWRASQGSSCWPAGASGLRRRGPGRRRLRGRGQAGRGYHDQLVRPDGEHLDVPARLGAAAEHQVHLMTVEQAADPVPVSRPPAAPPAAGTGSGSRSAARAGSARPRWSPPRCAARRAPDPPRRPRPARPRPAGPGRGGHSPRTPARPR